MDFATRALHSGFDSSAWGGSSVMPIVASAAYSPGTPEALEDIFAGRSPGHVYGRLTNPTVTALERRWAAIEEGARGCAAFSTGMAAVSAVFTALTESGEEVVSSSSLFGGTRSYFNNVLSRTGVTVVSVDPDDMDAVRRAVTPKTRLLFLEALGNPRMDVPDIEAWSRIASDANIPLILDTTLVTPALFRAKEYGVAVTVQSGTKFLTGNGTVLSGAVTDTGVYRWKNFPGSAVKGHGRKNRQRHGLSRVSPEGGPTEYGRIALAFRRVSGSAGFRHAGFAHGQTQRQRPWLWPSIWKAGMTFRPYPKSVWPHLHGMIGRPVISVIDGEVCSPFAPDHGMGRSVFCRV
jgi:O-acetylhomoserine/O-acetylserine sulfhydrylase-like pyridoxal-dependent enzyme